MFSRHSLAAAALLLTTFSAQADVVSVASAPTLTSASDFYLLRGVEGLYMVAYRTVSQTADLQPAIAPAPSNLAADIVTVPVVADVLPGNAAGVVIPDTPILIGIIAPVEADIDPIVNATEVPEPSSVALLLAGVLGAAGFTRARKPS